MPINDKLGVYVSVPFCRAKCSFCNFASGVSSPPVIASYVDRLCAEIDATVLTAERMGARLPRLVDSVYFGGGTPSLLEPAQLRAVFAAVHRNFEIEAGAEITLEAAPGQIADAVVDEAMRLGVNRVSLGVQSFVDRESAAVGRTHTERECVREIVRLRAAGLQDVGADLIAGLPHQTRESWRHSLEIATGVGLTHLSVYMLEIDEDSRLGREVMAGGVRFHAHAVPEDELSAEMYEMACEELPRAGFAQYEISNFALAGHPSRHNRKYWERKPYVGFGLDAHSMLERQELGIREQELGGAVRFANAEELKDYSVKDRVVTMIGEDEAFEEEMFLGLRLNEGVAVNVRCAEAARELVEGGLMWERDGRWGLTLAGRMVSNEVFGRLLEKEVSVC